MKTALLCVFLCLCLLSGCAGILGPASAPAEVALAGPRVAYRAVFTSKPGAATVAAASKGGLLDDNTADTAQIGIAAFFRKVPIIGWIIGGKMLAREAAKFGERGSGEDTPTAMLKLARDAAIAGCEVTLTVEPLVMEKK